MSLRMAAVVVLDNRDIVSEAGILPRTHGSALFTRGNTGLVVTTLGTGDDEQMINALTAIRLLATITLHSLVKLVVGYRVS